MVDGGVEEIVERFARLRVLKVKGDSMAVARETTMTMLNLVQIQFGVFGVRELLERIKDFTDWEITQLGANLNSNNASNDDFEKLYC